MATMSPVAIGTVVTAATPKRTRNIAHCANARTAKAITLNNAPANQRAAERPSTGKTKIVTTKTTIADVVGMEVTAALRATTAQSTPSIARNASAKTPKIRVAPPALGVASSRITRGMATATTRTTTAAALTMAVIAVNTQEL